MTYRLNILDTGDNYILALEKFGYYQDAIEIYKEMDISINEIKTEFYISQDMADFIYQSVGRVISYGFADTDANIRIDIPCKLQEDIKKTIEFYTVRSFWENMQYPPKPKKKDNENFFNDLSVINQSLCYFKQDPKHDIINKTYILYNNIYNIAFVFDNKKLQWNVNDFQKAFPEFVVAIESTSLHAISEDVMDAFKNIFHKKSFDKLEDINEKYNAFKSLYDIACDNNEKIRVKKYLDLCYVLSTDIEKRMKANDIYKEIINHMCIPYDDASAFKKRLAGYLMEFNLQKKRYSDAYYYYGVEKKTIPKLSLEELEEKRHEERKQFFKDGYIECFARSYGEDKKNIIKLSLEELEEKRHKERKQFFKDEYCEEKKANPEVSLEELERKQWFYKKERGKKAV